MSDFDLTRFVEAQGPVIATVRRELDEGRKRSHWMWFVFPQISGLGRSVTAQRYALSSLNEAAAYLGHPVLGPCLLDCSSLVLAVEGRSTNTIFGSPDDMKFHACMTLFAEVADAPPVFRDALQKYFGGVPDRLTLDRLAAAVPGR